MHRQIHQINQLVAEHGRQPSPGFSHQWTLPERGRNHKFSLSGEAPLEAAGRVEFFSFPG
jgi:hypothetical protein